MYVSNRLRFKKINDLSINSDNLSFESIFIEIEINNVCVIIGTIYRPPDTNISICNVHFNDLPRTISNERKKCILMAEFNIDLLTNDTNNLTADFVHNMFANMFYPTISKPTRIAQQSATLIDNIITNSHGYPINSGILYDDISDHFPILNFYNIGLKNYHQYIFKRANSVNNIAKLNAKVKNANWEEVYNDTNPNSSYDTFIGILNSHINECLPWKNIKIRPHTNDWLTKGILTSTKEKKHLYKKYKCNPTIENEHIYKRFKNKLTHVIRTSKKSYFKNKFDLYKNDCKKHGIPLMKF